MTARISWPHSALQPNSRLHWSKREKHRKAAKNEGFYAAKEAQLRAGPFLHLTLHPPDKRRRDIDNVLASLKSALDGIAAAIGQDDSEWTSILIERKEPRKGGCVLVDVK